MRILVTQIQVAKQLVAPVGGIGAIAQVATCALAYKRIIHQLLRLVVAPLEEQATDRRQRIGSRRISGILLAARPHRDLIQQDPLGLHTAIRHHADTSVAQGQALLPQLRRPVEEIRQLIV